MSINKIGISRIGNKFKFVSNSVLFAILVNLQFMIFQYFLRTKNISPDFLIFYETSERFLSKQNLYFSQDGGIGYAPTFLYFLFSPLTLLNPQSASNFFIILNYILIFSIIFLLKGQLPLKHLVIILTVLNASYSIRSIINNGQIGILVLVLQIFFLTLVNKKSTKTLFLKSGILFVLMELKPYLILPYFIYSIISRKKEAYLAIVYALVFEFIFFLINPMSTIYYYLKLILKRSQETKSEIDQSSFLSIVDGNITIFIAYLIMITVFTFRNFTKSEVKRAEILFLLAPLVSIYFHRQDSVFAILVFGLLLANLKSKINWLLMFLLLHTGSFNIYHLIQLLFMLLVLKFLIPLSKIAVLTVTLSLFLYSYMIYGVGVESGYQSTYQIWTVLVFSFQFLVFVYYVKSSKKISLFVRE